jgi:hypothetical protein
VHKNGIQKLEGGRHPISYIVLGIASAIPRNRVTSPLKSQEVNREESGLCLYKAPWLEINSSGCCAGSKLFSCASGMLLLEERRENSRARARDCATRAANPEPCKGIKAVRHIDHRRTQALFFLAQVNA